MKRIYISGPVTGDPDHVEKFAAAAGMLRKNGFEPVNPADLDLGAKATWDDYMAAAQDLQLSASGTHMLQGWRESKGATIEYWVARALGHRITGYPA